MGGSAGMAFYEERARRNGVMMPIQCIHMQLTASARVPRLHYHDYTELLFGVSGEAQVFIGSERYLLPAGSMVIIHTNQLHDVSCPAGACSYIVVKFLPQILLSGEQTLSEYGYMLMLMENAPGKQIFFPAAALAETALPALFRHLMTEWEAQSFGYELSLRADVTQVFLHILRCWREQNLPLLERIRETGQVELIRNALSFVREHFADLSEQEAAAACGVSVTYFSRVFKKAMKTSFSAFVTDTRLREAERLLLLTDDSVTDIAVAVGFSTASYFISRFGASRHMTPYRFRQQYRV